MNRHIKNTRLHSRRGVAPIIATLLLVAIAVVGGAIVFAYSQNFFSSSQVGGRPTIEAVKIVGYDARPGANILFHNGSPHSATNDGDAIKETDEHVAIYIKNDSVQPITISEARFGGVVYSYTSPTSGAIADVTSGQYALAGIPGGSGADLISTAQVAEIQPGQSASLVLALSEDMRSGRDVQFKLTTNNGAVFVGTVVIGQQSG
ncbi:MAG TPA: archaellin/type IV pilin N-terminal domain-containing protein [Candidatus Nitrosotenuis sp.]|nr:archaellin/type IV pilin N-terminal domain-containing protein [Candidatus Nitrosotenuis sp.]